jgi:phosphate transport system protein
MENANYQKELLNQNGLEMLNLGISQLEKATEAFINHDSDLAEEVIYTEAHVNALDIKIEKDCERYIALFNPVASDLRFIMAVLKINIELERIADHAYGISKYVVDIDQKISPKLFKTFKFYKMHETVLAMLENITIAYEEKNVKAARKVFKKDKILDKINAESFMIVEEELKKDTSAIKQILLMFAVIKKIERVGDLIKNIAEEIIFYIDAEILKHKKKK